MSYDTNNPSLLEPEEQVLTTLERDGSRRWLYPRLSKGRYLLWRRVVAYGLIVLFHVLPFVKINGEPAMLLDILRRRFHLFGVTFLPTDTFLLALFLLSVFLTIFFVTAMLGRIWCGWGCPQTVYFEFVFRPIERLFDGRSGLGGKPAKEPSVWRTAAKYLVFLLLCVHLTHVFLAYFVGVDQLAKWSLGSPLNHPTAFAFILFCTALLMFHACVFREQLCIVACPYGRLQSVLLDESSMIISYDTNRGETRGKLGREKRLAFEEKSKPVDQRTLGLDILRQNGDCIDCGACVTTCPTGIDIRKGLQLECVGCAQCIDACDAIMDRVGRPRGLVRYTSQRALRGEARRILRPRVVIYPLLIAVFFGLFLFILMNRALADITPMRGMGRPFIVLESGQIENQLRLKIVNRDVQTHRYSVGVAGPAGVLARMQGDSVTIEPTQSLTVPVDLTAAFEMFRDGRLDVQLQVSDETEVVAREMFQMKGPYQKPAAGNNASPTQGATP